MDERERETVALLSTLRGFEPPRAAPAGAAAEAAPGPAMVERAVRAGRLRVRARRAAAATASAAAIAALAVSVALADRAADSPGAAAGHFTAHGPAFTVGSAGGFAPARYEAGRDVQRITLRVERPGGALRADGLVEMYPPGRLPPGGEGHVPSGRRSADVHGRPAWLLAAPLLRAGAVELAWEWRPGAWGFVSLRGPGADAARAHHVAEGVLPANAQTRP